MCQTLLDTDSSLLNWVFDEWYLNLSFCILSTQIIDVILVAQKNGVATRILFLMLDAFHPHQMLPTPQTVFSMLLKDPAKGKTFYIMLKLPIIIIKNKNFYIFTKKKWEINLFFHLASVIGLI